MMSKVYFKRILVFFAVFFFTACKSYVPSYESASLIKANRSAKADSSIKIFYKPYKDSLDKIMKITLAELEEDLTKKLPESNLGNLMVDILKAKTQQYTNNVIDVAILNYGGIRVPSLTKGMLNIEHAYLLMPFDNYLVEQMMTGQQISDFCDSIATKKGWPISGISFKIKQNKSFDILINNEPVDLTKKYSVALIDYVANGGDGMTFLKSIPQKQTGVLFRDAIIEYWQDQTKAGKKISSKIENRISYAE